AARAFAGRAMRVVAAGRPDCPLCGLTLALAWDAESSRVIVEAQEAVEVDPEAETEEVEVFSETGPADRDVLRVHLTPAAARAFAGRAMRVVAAGRPDCPLCGLPLDPAGHIRPRQTGYRPAEA